ncbi:MAG: hypothetical protein OXN23_08040 [Gammaproteobacteria bacterium]|nr:hypothetical protein [Gammaproteobacteria bacterium]
MAKNRRFKDRHLQLFDLVDRFEAVPSSTHVYKALATIERLKDEGLKFWDEGSSQLTHWQGYCSALWTFLNTELGKRRHIEKQDLATALREYNAEFEHSTHGMFEMLYGISDNPDNDERIKQMLCWFDLAYRLSAYAITSFWIDEKSDQSSVKIKMNVTTGERAEDWSYKGMEKPKYRKHQRGTEKL